MNKAEPRVSVVLPTYNQAEYLPRALEGVFAQTFPDYELIVVNDGSTDDTAQILDKFRHHYDFILIQQENQRLPRALNIGFGQARGSYLTWTSSDNVMLPSMLETLVDALNNHPNVGLVYADWIVIDEHDQVIGTVRTLDHDRHLLMRMNYINACFLYRRECQEEIGLYDPRYLYSEDWEYWWRISEKFSMLRIPQVLYHYRQHGSSLTEQEVLSNGASEGYVKLAKRFRSRRIAWYISKLKWEWLKLKLRHQPNSRLQVSARH